MDENDYEINHNPLYYLNKTLSTKFLWLPAAPSKCFMPTWDFILFISDTTFEGILGCINTVGELVFAAMAEPANASGKSVPKATKVFEKSKFKPFSTARFVSYLVAPENLVGLGRDFSKFEEITAVPPTI